MKIRLSKGEMEQYRAFDFGSGFKSLAGLRLGPAANLPIAHTLAWMPWQLKKYVPNVGL